MQYIELRMKMFGLVDLLIKESKHIQQDITFDVMRNTGFSEKAIEKYIERLIECGKVVNNKGVLIWSK